MSKLISRATVVTVIILIVSGCFLWQLTNSTIVGPKADRRVRSILTSVFALELTNSWRTVNASGGLVGSPFYSIRWRREFFVQKENSRVALEDLSRELSERRRSIADFFPAEDPVPIMPHQASAKLASWWQPATNSGPGMSGYLVHGDTIAYVYGYTKGTNAVIYIHVIER